MSKSLHAPHMLTIAFLTGENFTRIVIIDTINIQLLRYIWGWVVKDVTDIETKDAFFVRNIRGKITSRAISSQDGVSVICGDILETIRNCCGSVFYLPFPTSHLLINFVIRQRCSVALVGFLLFSGSVFSTAVAQDYDALVQRARAGDTEPALVYLRQADPNISRAQQFDHILIASWAGKSAEVIEVYNRLLPDSETSSSPPPAYVYQAVGRAFRDLKRWPEAQTVWRLGLHQYPREQADFAAGLTMTLADAGQGAEAVRTGQNFVDRFPNDADLRMALAYAYKTQNRTSEVLSQTQRAVELAPQTAWIREEYVHVLRQVGQSERALREARRLPGRFSAAQIRALEADAAAYLTRLAGVADLSDSERFAAADRALARYDELIPAWEALGPQAADDLFRIRIDRLSALHARIYMPTLVEEYEGLLDSGASVPTWALSDVASAYLYMRQPEKARDLYLDLLVDLEANTSLEASDTFDVATARLGHEIGLYYALTEAEQFDKIEPLLENIRHYADNWPERDGQINPNYLAAKRLLAAADLAMDNTPAAQEKMEELVDLAPDDAGLRINLAGIYRARAQPRLAEAHLQLAETLEPNSLALKANQGMIAMDLQEWRLAEALVEETMALSPQHRDTYRLARAWQVHNMAELRVNGHLGLSSDNPAASAGDYGFDTVFYSQPIDYNWRLFVGGGHKDGDFNEGHGYYSWLRGGLEWRGRDMWLEGEVSANHYAHQTKMGARLSGYYDLDDYWRVGFNLEHHSRQTPLRALRSNIASDVTEGYIRWRAHDRREWWLGFDAIHFSDNNNRFSLNLKGVERLYSAPHLNVDLLFDISSRFSSKDDDRPYFNPKRDVMLLPALRATQILYRRYEQVWEHYAILSAGAYAQKYYGMDSVFSFEYGQRYRPNDVFEIGASIYGISRPYDGTREHEWRLLLNMTSRF